MALHVARSRSAACSSTDMSQGRTWSAPAAQQWTFGTSASSRVTTTRDVFSPRLVGVASSLPDFSFQESLQAVTERLRLRSRSSPPDEDRRRSPPRNRRRHRPARRLLPVPAARPRPLVQESLQARALRAASARPRRESEACHAAAPHAPGTNVAARPRWHRRRRPRTRRAHFAAPGARVRACRVSG